MSKTAAVYLGSSWLIMLHLATIRLDASNRNTHMLHVHKITNRQKKKNKQKYINTILLMIGGNQTNTSNMEERWCRSDVGYDKSFDMQKTT